jgi:S-adenosylmethionine synthetase
MTMEATAGKNPVTHIGKIYSVVARRIAEALLAEEPDISAAQCLLVGRIGTPLTEPTLVHVKLATRDKIPVSMFARRTDEIARAHLGRALELIDDFVAGTLVLF